MDNRESLIDFSYYIVFENGDIFSKSIAKKTRNTTNENGYIRNSYKCTDGVIRPFYRERVIYYYFKGEIPSGMAIDHINGNKLDNRLENLRCVTPVENAHNEITFSKWRKANIPPIHNTPHSEASKKKMSEALKGRQLSDETKQKISEALKGENNPFYGKHHSDETILKRSVEVYVLDKEKNLVSYYISINKCEADGYSHVKDKLEKKRKDKNGFIFLTKDEYINLKK